MKKNFFNFSLMVLFLGLSLNSVNAMRGFGDGIWGKLQEKIYGWGLNRALSGNLEEKIKITLKSNYRGEDEFFELKKSVAENIDFIKGILVYGVEDNNIVIKLENIELDVEAFKVILDLEISAKELKLQGKSEFEILQKLSKQENTVFFNIDRLEKVLVTADYLGARMTLKIFSWGLLKQCKFKVSDENISKFAKSRVFKSFKNFIASFLNDFHITLLNKLECEKNSLNFKFNGKVLPVDFDFIKKMQLLSCLNSFKESFSYISDTFASLSFGGVVNYYRDLYRISKNAMNHPNINGVRSKFVVCIFTAMYILYPHLIKSIVYKEILDEIGNNAFYDIIQVEQKTLGAMFILVKLFFVKMRDIDITNIRSEDFLRLVSQFCEGLPVLGIFPLLHKQLKKRKDFYKKMELSYEKNNY